MVDYGPFVEELLFDSLLRIAKEPRNRLGLPLEIRWQVRREQVFDIGIWVRAWKLLGIQTSEEEGCTHARA